MKRNLEFIINKRSDRFGLEIFFIERNGDKISLAEPITLTFKEYKEAEEADEPAKPTLFLPGFYADEFLKAMSKAIHKEGYTDEEENITKGKLEATKYHLEDMRKLVLNKEIKNVKKEK